MLLTRYTFPPPCSSIFEIGEYEATPHISDSISRDIVDEITRLRRLFFNLFVMAVVRMVEGEDVIWLLEEAGSSRNLHVFERTRGSHGSRA
jgi:hypothetical protein